MKYKITLDGRTYEIEVVEENAMLLSEYETIAPTAPAAAPVAPAAPAAAPAPTITGAGESVNTPMPGTILQVLVSVGQTVKEGDVLVVLEAMKMENEITSPKNGTVTQVIAQPGTTVDTGVALVVIQ